MSERLPRRSLWSVLWRGLRGNVRFALSAILEHKLRSSLTVLGIVVGVTTVMVMVAIVTGFNNNVIGNLQAFGANRIEFQKYEESFGPGDSDYEEQRKRHNLTMEDAGAAFSPEQAAQIQALFREQTQLRAQVQPPDSARLSQIERETLVKVLRLLNPAQRAALSK